MTDVFCNLPVRQSEFVKNIAKEYARLVPVVQAYALVSVGVRISLSNVTPAGKRQLVFASVGAPRILDNVAAVFSAKEAQSLEPIEADVVPAANGLAVRVDGAVTSLNASAGRRANDRHFVFVNRRPVDIAQLSRITTDCFRTSGQNDGRFPFVALNFTLPSDRVDINVTPDKRTVYLADQERFLEAGRTLLSTHYAASHSRAHVIGASVAASQSTIIPLRFAPAGGIPRAPALVVSPPDKAPLVIEHVCAHGDDHHHHDGDVGAVPDLPPSPSQRAKKEVLSGDVEVVLTPEEVRAAPPANRDKERNLFESFSFASRSASSPLPRAASLAPPDAAPLKRGRSQLATTTLTKLWKAQGGSRKRAHADGDDVGDDGAILRPSQSGRASDSIVRITDDEPIVFDAIRQLSAADAQGNSRIARVCFVARQLMFSCRGRARGHFFGGDVAL